MRKALIWIAVLWCIHDAAAYADSSQPMYCSLVAPIITGGSDLDDNQVEWS